MKKYLWFILTISIIFHFLNSKKDLPVKPENDELYWIPAAVHMTENSWNPGWFGHPGATVLHPLAATAVLLDVPDLPEKTLYRASQSTLYKIGRLIAIAYSIGSLVLFWLLGKRMFDQYIATIATALFAVLPLPMTFGTIARSDSAALFFGLLSLLLAWEYTHRKEQKRLLYAAIAVGAAISTRYFMVAFSIPLLWILWNEKERWKHLLLSMIAICITFLVLNPYWILEWNTVLENLLHEARSVNAGSQTFGYAGNLLWYIFVALPQELGIPLFVLLLFGVWKITSKSVNQFTSEQRIIFSAIPVFLLTISTLSLHWNHWIIQVLPLCCLLAAYGLQSATQSHISQKYRTYAIIAGCILLMFEPVQSTIETTHAHMQPGTAVQMREWILENIDANATIAQEWWSAPLEGHPYTVITAHPLSVYGSLQDFRTQGIEYLVIDRTLADSSSDPFYEHIYNECVRMKRVEGVRGHILELYRIDYN